MKAENYRNYYEELTKTPVPKGFDVHHIDLDRDNNDIKNLVALPRKIHQAYHENLQYVLVPIKFGTKLQSSLEPGYMYNEVTLQRVAEFQEAYFEGIKWVDFRNHLLGECRDIHNMKSKYNGNT